MQLACRAVALACAAAWLCVGASALQMGPPGAQAQPGETEADVIQLHGKLSVVAASLDTLLASGKLSNTPIAAELLTFLRELHATLNATSSPKDSRASLKRLRDAQAGMTEMTRFFGEQQERLMREDEKDRESLLLGVLMSSREEPLAKQLDILRKPDFAGLPVSRQLLAGHDAAKPLFAQAAELLDQHGGEGAVADPKAARLAELAQTQRFFKSRIDRLQTAVAGLGRARAEQEEKIDGLMKSAPPKDARLLGYIKKRQEHKFKKVLASEQAQLAIMEQVVAALKRGDIKALDRAQSALQASLRSLKSRSGAFLHLLQIGARLEERDCALCRATCVTRCRAGGSTFSQCAEGCGGPGR